MHTSYTLELTPEWDLQLDSAGNIQTCINDYAVAQNVANSCRLFTNDAYFNVERGIPWFTVQLGKPIMASLTTTWLRKTAAETEGVAEVKQVTLDLDNYDPRVRDLRGEILFVTDAGAYVSVDI